MWLDPPDSRLVIFIGRIYMNLTEGATRALEVAMAEHDEVYGEERAKRLAALLRALAARILELDQAGQLLGGGPELLRMMGDARSELFHYEVRSTYDTPEVADSRRIVEEAQHQDSFLPDEPEDEEPWRRRRPE
jgi:PAS domain-containing protein